MAPTNSVVQAVVNNSRKFMTVPQQSAANEAKSAAPSAADASADSSASANSSPPEKKSAKSLTPEEQMARYEDELKETDWGHQPC